jgi:hypothetical protein
MFHKLNKSSSVFLFLVLFLPSASANFVLENSTEWYTKGNTLINSVFVSDLDNDGKEEIITGGRYTHLWWGSQLTIWNKTGENLYLENTTEWYNSSGDSEVYSVYVADVDEDEEKEIITGGYEVSFAQIKISNKSVSTLNLEKVINWKTGATNDVRSIDYGDIDNDGKGEIITVGCIPFAYGQLRVWNITDGTLNLENTTEWRKNGTAAFSLSVADIDDDETLEMITGGYIEGGEVPQLRVWNRSYNLLNLENETIWVTNGTGDCGFITSVYVADIDADQELEIITGSSRYDTKCIAQLRIWNKTGEVLTLEYGIEWSGDNSIFLRALHVADVDGDGKVEIITGSIQKDSPDKVQLRVWNVSDGTINMEGNIQWSTIGNTYIESVFVAEIDGDGTSEIITGGSYWDVTSTSNAQLRIWHFDNIPPAIGFISPTPENNSILNVDTITINVSHKELNPHTLILNWNGTNESYSYSGNHTSITKLVEDGTYTFYVSVPEKVKVSLI